MIRRYAAMAVLGAAILGLSLGCGPTLTKVEVKVTFDDKPLEGAGVTFTSEADAAIFAGVTDANGVAAIKTPAKNGVAAGSYIVTITKLETFDTPSDPTKAMQDRMKQAPGGNPNAGGFNPGAGAGAKPMGMQPKSLIPTKYGEVKSSEFRYKVPEDTSGVKEFKLSSK
jgi:hypothetical protein